MPRSPLTCQAVVAVDLDGLHRLPLLLAQPARGGVGRALPARLLAQQQRLELQQGAVVLADGLPEFLVLVALRPFALEIQRPPDQLARLRASRRRRRRPRLAAPRDAVPIARPAAAGVQLPRRRARPLHGRGAAASRAALRGRCRGARRRRRRAAAAAARAPAPLPGSAARSHPPAAAAPPPPPRARGAPAPARPRLRPPAAGTAAPRRAPAPFASAPLRSPGAASPSRPLLIPIPTALAVPVPPPSGREPSLRRAAAGSRWLRPLHEGTEAVPRRLPCPRHPPLRGLTFSSIGFSHFLTNGWMPTDRQDTARFEGSVAAFPTRTQEHGRQHHAHTAQVS